MLSYLALMAYLLAFVHILLFLFFGNKLYRILSNIFIGVGVAIDIGELCRRFALTGQFPSSTLNDFLLLLSLGFAFTYILLYIKYKRPLVGLFILPFLLLFTIGGLMVPIEDPYPFVASVWFYGHLPFAIFGTTFFVAAFLSAVMYFIQERQLKGKRFGFIFQRFPPLDTINKINNTALKVGFHFFTIGALLGFVWMLQGGFENLLSSSKVIFSIITWVVFGAILVIKHKWGILPRQMALLTIIGFFSVIVTYVGVAMFLLR